MNEEIENILTNKKIKPTAVRILVLKELLSQSKAINLFELEKKFEKVERTTLFRNLRTFVQNNLIHEIDDGTRAAKYALCDDDCTCKIDDLHLHFFCTRCKKTFCLRENNIPTIQLPDNFLVETASFVVKGICNQCNS